MVNDTIADFLTRLRNASRSGKLEVETIFSRTVMELAKMFKSEGFIDSITTKDNRLHLTLSQTRQYNQLKRLSKPGRRLYVKLNDIPRSKTGLGMIILSTPKGLLTDAQARKQKVGGELICEVW